MSSTSLATWTVAILTLLLWTVPVELRAQNDGQPEANDEEPPAAADEPEEEQEAATEEDREEEATTEEDDAAGRADEAEREDTVGDEDAEEADAEETPADDAEAQDDLLEPAARTADLDERWQRFAGGFFNRAPVRSYVGAMGRWSAQIDGPNAFGQFSLEAWSEFSPFEVEDYALSFLAHWGFSIGYSDASGGASAFQVIQPLYLGAKFNLLAEDDYYFSAATMLGFINDSVAGEYNPMNLLPGSSFYWHLSAMFSYALPDVDFAFNTELVLHFNFGFFVNTASLSWLIEAVYMFSSDFVMRAGFDFHTIASGANIFVQGDFWLDDDFMLFAQFKGFLSGTGRVFDFALMAGATYHF